MKLKVRNHTVKNDSDSLFLRVPCFIVADRKQCIFNIFSITSHAHQEKCYQRLTWAEE